jgi:hypothetical protein
MIEIMIQKGRNNLKASGITMLVITCGLLPGVASAHIMPSSDDNGNLHIFILGLFPKCGLDGTITYWSLYANNSQLPQGNSVTIHCYNHFSGYTGRLLIYGTITYLLPPSGTFITEKDVLRIIDRPIHFYSTSADLDGTIVDTQWSFDDSPSWQSGMNITCTFTTEGHHNVTLKVTDNTGLTTTRTASVRVYPRTPCYQCYADQDDHTLTIIGMSVVGNNEMYNWSDFTNIGSGTCTLPTSGSPHIGDMISWEGEIILVYVPNGNIAYQWPVI